MTIAELATLGKQSLGRIPPQALILGIVALASSASFGLGILEGREMGSGGDISIQELATTSPGFLTQSQESLGGGGAMAAPASLPSGGEYVASKNGAKYYLPWCGGAKLIKDENKVWFASKEEAESKGFAPAANCKGL